MKKITYLILLLLIFSNTSKSQSLENRLGSGDFLLKLSPFSILNPDFATIDIGASYFISSKIGLQLKYGMKYDLSGIDTFKTDGFKTLMEFQYVFSRKWYGALELGLSRNRYSVEHSSSYINYLYSMNREPELKVRNDYKYHVAPKVGYLIFISENIIIDFYAGIGFKLIVGEVENSDYVIGTINGTKYDSTIEMLMNELHYTFGLNINYRF